MKKLITNFILSNIVFTPLFTLSVKKNANEYEYNMDEYYALYDFIKLTGRQNAKIYNVRSISNSILPNAKMVMYDNEGYSIISSKTKHIYEVNPFYYDYYKWNEKGKLELKSSSYNNFRKTNQKNVVPFDKTMPGDHKHTDNSINRDFINFNMNKLTQVQNAKKSDFAKYNIHEIINGSLKADDEINHSWWFKYISDSTYGENSYINANKDFLTPETEYYKKFPSYYNKKNQRWLGEDDDGGLCGYISSISLLQYYEFFISKGYLNDWEKNEFLNKKEYKNDNENIFIESLRNTNNFDINYNIENMIAPSLTNNFVKYTFQKTWFPYGMSKWWQIKYVFESLLNKKWKNSQINYSYWGQYGEFARPDQTIRKYRIPTILGGYYGFANYSEPGHFVVAYGVYNDGRLLVNFGYDNKWSQVIVKHSNEIYNFNFTLNNKSNNGLDSIFNWNGIKKTGPEITEILSRNGIVNG